MSRRSKQAPAFGPRLPFLILSAFVCAYGFSIEPAPDIKRIQDRGELVVAMFREDVYPLFYMDEHGTLRGHEVDLAKEIASNLGVELRIDRSAATFDGVVDIVGKGGADLGISYVSMTYSRLARVRFSDPYLVVHPVLIVNRLSKLDIEDPETIDRVGEEAISVSERKGTSYVEIAKTIFPLARIVLEDDWDAVMLNVASRRVDAVLRDEIGVRNYIAANAGFLVNVKRIVLTDVNDMIGVAVRPGAAQLEYLVNIFLRRQGYPIGARELFEKYAE